MDEGIIFVCDQISFKEKNKQLGRERCALNGHSFKMSKHKFIFTLHPVPDVILSLSTAWWTMCRHLVLVEKRFFDSNY